MLFSKNFRRSIAVILLIFFAVSTAISQSQDLTELGQKEQKDRSAELEKKRREKRKLQKDQNKLLNRENSLLTQLKKIDDELDRNRKLLNELQIEIQKNQNRASEFESDLAQLKQKYREYNLLLSKRLRAIYKMSYNSENSQIVKMLISSTSFADLLRRYKYANIITESDRRLIEKIRSQQSQIVATFSDLQKTISEIELSTKHAKKKQIEIVAKKRKREKLLHSYRTRREINERTLIELQAAVRELEQLLGVVSTETIVEDAKNIRGISRKMRGKLPMPVKGRIVKNQNPHDRGITIRAKSGIEVRCVADGVVGRTQSVVGYGNTILIVHGDDYTSVYTHLSTSNVKSGDRVKTDQVIGKVGDTGSLIGDGLYFELWHNYARLDTKKWIKK